MEHLFLEHKEITFGKHYFPLHLHPQYCTLSFTLSGNAILIGQNQKIELKKGDISIVPPHIPHQTIIDEEFRYKVIRLNISLFNAFPKNIQFINQQTNSQIYTDLSRLILEHEEGDFNEEWAKFLYGQYEIPHIRIDSHLNKVLEYIYENFKESIALEDLGRIANMSVSHFHRKFSKVYALSPMQYIMSMRIDHAKKAMQAGKSLTQVALESGFYDQSHFIKYFKRYAGLRPKKYLALLSS